MRTVVFDKTGTLTLGRPVVTEHRIFNDRVRPDPSAHVSKPTSNAVFNELHELFR